MKRPPSTDQLLAALHQAKEDPEAAESQETLRQALQRGTFLPVTLATELIEREMCPGFEADLEAALLRLMDGRAETDPGCQAKFALANFLYRQEAGTPTTWLSLVSYKQWEPVWGKRIDSAGNLRGLAAHALVQIGFPDAAFELLPLLVDPEIEARSHAAQALGELGRAEGELLLRLKVLTGDEETVICDCLEALATGYPERSLEFVAGYLKSDNSTLREGAAIALGQTHSGRAYDLLIRAWTDSPTPSARAELARGLAFHRSEESFHFLLQELKERDPQTAAAIVAALKIWSGDPERRSKVESVVRKRNVPKLLETFSVIFG